MDPVSVIGLVESSLSLALQFGSAAKTLNDVAGRYKNTKLAIRSLAQNLDILQLAWTQIGEWFQEYVGGENLIDDSLTKRVQGFLETGRLVMEALQHDVETYDVDYLSFSQRSKFIWNENSLQGYQSRIRDQALSMSLFLQALNLPKPQARAKLLQSSEVQFQKSHESAYSTDSIVPSRMSVSTSCRDSYASCQIQDTIKYRRLSFEQGLFMSKVYMRSSKKVMIKELSLAKTSPKRRFPVTETDQMVTDSEAIRDQLEADSLLDTSCEASIKDNETNRYETLSESRPHLFEENSDSSAASMTSDEELILACQQGDSLQIKGLIDRGLDLHAPLKKTRYSGLKSIHVAAMHGHVNIVETLLGCGALIEEEETSQRWRPLHFAAKGGLGPMTRFLIQKGAQIDAKARYRIQPIHEASLSGSIEVLDVLIEAGAVVDCSDMLGCQPLHWATMAPNRSNVIRYLSRKGADIEATASGGCRPLQLACTSDFTNLCTLIALGAKTEYDDESESPLETAVKRHFKWALEILLKHGADPNRQNVDGQTVLHTLARIGHTATLGSPNRIEICELLLNSGADVNLADNAGNRILHYLALHSNNWVVDRHAMKRLTKLILARGAAIDAMNADGLSALCLAMQKDNRYLSRQLVRSGARKLKKTSLIEAEVHVTTVPDSQTPKYTVNIQRNDHGVVQRWRLSTPILEQFLR